MGGGDASCNCIGMQGWCTAPLHDDPGISEARLSVRCPLDRFEILILNSCWIAICGDHSEPIPQSVCSLAHPFRAVASGLRWGVLP